MVNAYEGNAYLDLTANPKHWGGKCAFETVVFKFVPDATSRVAERVIYYFYVRREAAV